MRAALKRRRWARGQRHQEYAAYVYGSANQWNQARRINNVTGVWRHQRTRDRARTGVLVSVALAYLVVCALLTGCSAHRPDQAACRAALTAQWRQALGDPTTVAPGTEPQACKGLDAATLQRLWTQAGDAAAS